MTVSTSEPLAAWVESWARPHHISVRRGSEPRLPRLTATPSNRVTVVNLDPRTDFGRVAYRTPACIIEPSTQDELVECVRNLSAARVPVTVRGWAHSTGGQVLTEGGVVISTRRLRRVISDSAETQRICVEGGTPWADVVRYLRPLARRPVVVTSDLLTSVAGTLSAGGVGTTSFVHGLQIATVTKLVLVLPTGKTVCAGPGNELFHYTLAGAGQLGIIAQAEVKTLRRPAQFLAWHLRWRSLTEFCEAAARIREIRHLDVLRARFYYRTPSSPSFVDGYVGVFCDGDVAVASRPALPGARGRLAVRELWPPDPIPDDWSAPEATQEGASLALRFSLAVPDGLPVWDQVVRELERAELTPFMWPGSPVQLLRVDSTYPLAPFPDSDECVFISLHSEMPRRNVHTALTVIRGIANRVLDAGGKLDLTSVRPKGDFLCRQFGAALDRFRELKARVDPDGLLNPGLLTPEPSGARKRRRTTHEGAS